MLGTKSKRDNGEEGGTKEFIIKENVSCWKVKMNSAVRKGGTPNAVGKEWWEDRYGQSEEVS